MSIKYFKYLLYFVVLNTISIAKAGSFDDFFIALRNDDVQVVRRLLDLGFELNAADAHGQPGLSVAIRAESPKVVKVLLERPGIDVNALNAAGESPLMLAAIQGDLVDVKLLIGHGARVNQPGWSALHYAAASPHTDVLKFLIEQGADVQARSPNGTTPLMMAAQYGSEDVIDLLLAHGADAQARNDLDLGVVDFAKLSGRRPVVEHLQKLH